MKKKLFTLLTLALAVCSGAWGEANTYEWSQNGVFKTLSVTAAKGTGNASTYSKYNISYYAADGKKYTCSTAVKMESTTTLTFTTSKKANIIVGIALKSGNTYTKATVKLDETETESVVSSSTTGATTEDGLMATVENVEAGSHTVSRGNAELGVFYIRVEEIDESKPSITAQPSSASYTTGDAAIALTVTATASEGDLSYQWKSCTAADKTGAADISGATSSSYTPSTASAGTYYYYCTVSDTNGSTDSNVATITVTDPTAPGISVGSTNYSTSRGTAVTLTATATGSPTPTVTWYQSETATNSGGTEIGTGTSFNPDVTTEGTLYYYAVAANGISPDATSEVITVTVTNPDKTISGNNYYVAVGEITAPGENIFCDNITMQYSDGTYAAATSDESTKSIVSGFVASANCSTNGWGVTFNPSASGMLKVGVVINKDKTFTITNVTAFSYEDSNNNSGTILNNTWKPSDKVYGVVTIAVNAGKSYYFSVGGSKMGFYGFEFTPATSTKVTLNTSGYATYSTYYDVVVSGAKAYTATLDFNAAKITCTEITSNKVPAGAGVLLYGDPNAEVTLTPTTGAATLTGNNLKGTTQADGTLTDKGSNDYYVLSGNTFKKFTGPAFTANKAYFEVASGAVQARAFSIVFDKETTGISQIETTTESMDGSVYNLSGQRVSQPTKGLYIVNGKKFMVK